MQSFLNITKTLYFAHTVYNYVFLMILKTKCDYAYSIK
jgi:hypothetical protein